ncbi:hypothetical protein T03_14696 [Trichinella britovi]|uniref:Uncharacterized protein n=1 Tax=Trichinella britovi TaxID=45882 RepID=A0A0V1CC73_TRIBR|nr:hypothetical protein T03_14696 [Trichinella britovi]
MNNVELFERRVRNEHDALDEKQQYQRQQQQQQQEEAAELKNNKQNTSATVRSRGEGKNDDHTTHTHKVCLQPRHAGSTRRSTFIQHNNSNLVNSRQARQGVAISHSRGPPPQMRLSAHHLLCNSSTLIHCSK